MNKISFDPHGFFAVSLIYAPDNHYYDKSFYFPQRTAFEAVPFTDVFPAFFTALTL